MLKTRRRILIAASLIVTSVTLACFGLLRAAPQDAALPTFEQLEAALQDKDFAEAERIAQVLLGRPPDENTPQGLLLYVKGRRVAAVAENAPDDERRRLNRVAAGYFRQALDQCLPESLWKPAVLQAATCQYNAGRFLACLRLLQHAIEVGLEPAPAIDRLLANAYWRLPNPDLAKALAHLDRYLQSPSLSPAQQEAAMLDRIELLISQNRVEEARPTLEAFAANGDAQARIRLLRALLRFQQAMQLRTDESDAEKAATDRQTCLNQARDLAEQVRQNTPIDQLERRRADYLYGVCLRELGDQEGAYQVFSAARRLYHGHASGMAAGLAEAELLQQFERHEEALAVFQKLLAEAPPPTEYSNPWVSLDGFRARLAAAYARWLGQRRFDDAIALTRAFPPLFPRDQALQLHAEARSEWARHLLIEAESQDAEEAILKTSEARRQYRLAGVLFAQTALLQTTSRDYPDQIWRSAESYLRGHDYRHAARMFRLYLDQDSKSRRAEALVNLSESLLALGAVEQSLETLLPVFESLSHHPAAYRARILAAQAHREKGDLAAAQSILRENLENEALAPQSIEWRDSQFLLGELLHDAARQCAVESRVSEFTQNEPQSNQASLIKLRECFDFAQEAAKTLEEAVTRYPQAPQTIRAQYLLAEAYRLAAKYPRHRLPSMTLDATRTAVKQEMTDALTNAITAYEKLIEQLTARENRIAPDAKVTELTEVEQAILRNAYFGRADALFDLERYEEAIRAYTMAANRYQNEPAALEAFVQIAGCHRRLNRTAEAIDVLEHAQAVLDRLSPDADFERTTRYGRKQWEQLLTLLAAE